ncbi:endonuclease/exonuclease/phosphatase family protein, partial [Corynebacterium hesseae]
VGEATLLEDARFKGTARTPLAAEFQPVSDRCAVEGPDSFVVVTNHFKSKGSVANGDADTGDGQGNNPNVRNAHAQAVLDGLAKQPQWQKKATFVMGDLNTYSKEDAISVFRNAGYTIPVEELNAQEDWQNVASYQFSGRLGSLDHILANEHVDAQAAQTWNINSDEPIAMEYSRRNYTGGDVFEADNPYRSSDHDPVKVGFNLATVKRTDNQLKDCTTTDEPDPSEEPAPSEEPDQTDDDDKVDTKPTHSSGSSAGEHCLPTALGLTIPAALAIPVAFLGFANTQFNIPGFEPVRKQIESMTRNIPREAQYAVGGLGLLAALGIIGAACAPTESE